MLGRMIDPFQQTVYEVTSHECLESLKEGKSVQRHQFKKIKKIWYTFEQ